MPAPDITYHRRGYVEDDELPPIPHFWVPNTIQLTELVSTSQVKTSTYTLYPGTKTLSTSATALTPATTSAKWTMLQSDPSNTDNIKVGTSTAQPFVLEPGDVLILPAPPEKIVVVASSGTPTLNYIYGV